MAEAQMATQWVAVESAVEVDAAAMEMDEAQVVAGKKPGEGGKATRNDSIMSPTKEIFYQTEEDSSGANVLRKIRCGCFDPSYTFTTEAIKVSEFHCCHGGCCVRKNESIDVDEIKDMSLVQTAGPGMLLYSRGHMIIHALKRGDSETQAYHIWHVENAPKVFREYASHVSKMNNLVLGMARPETAGPELMYDSKNDSTTIKCCRTFLCCGCCCFPNTTISKRHVITDGWGCSAQYLRWYNCCACLVKMHRIVDVDYIKDVNMEQSCLDLCMGTGKILIEAPQDIDQDSVTVKFVQNGKAVFKQFDEYVNKLDNRQRIVGEGSMGR